MKLYNALYKDFESLFVGYSALAIILSTCLGAASAMVILMNGHNFIQMAQLFLVTVGCMAYLVSILSQMKPRFVFNSLILALTISAVLLALNVWMRY